MARERESTDHESADDFTDLVESIDEEEGLIPAPVWRGPGRRPRRRPADETGAPEGEV